MSERRVILIVLDSLGAGEMPDAGTYGDQGAHTINHIADRMPSLDLPNMNRLGYGRIEGIHIPDRRKPIPAGVFGRAAEMSRGKDTITGHWEIAGIITRTPFQTFTENGFPEPFIHAFEERIVTRVLGNYAASGTEIIQTLGPQHKETGYPIVYTSADSVFQIAANIDVIPLEKLYEICETAREMLQGDLLVGRVIARPFVEKDGVYTRTADRKDYSLDPPSATLLNRIQEAGLEVSAVGKIRDIFNGNGITRSVHISDNRDGVEKTLEYMDCCEGGLIFTNLVDFDSKYGHRRDPLGYGRALEEFDTMLPAVLQKMKPDDILILCADHGNDPVHTGWNHTREYVPILVYGDPVRGDCNLGTRSTFADIGATVAEYLGIQWGLAGTSFLSVILQNG